MSHIEILAEDSRTRNLLKMSKGYAADLAAAEFPTYR